MLYYKYMNASSRKKIIIGCVAFIILGAILALSSIPAMKETASLRSAGKLESLTVIDVKTKKEGKNGSEYVIPVVDVRGAAIEVSNTIHNGKKYSAGDTISVYATTSGTPFARVPNTDNKVGSLGEEVALAIGAVFAALGVAGIVLSLRKSK